MANLFGSNYDPRQMSGTSGAEVSDLRPEQAYDTDLRRIEQEQRDSATSINDDQDRVAKFMRAAKTAGKFRQAAGIAEPTLRGVTPRTRATIDGTELPSRGDSGGRTGTVAYARKPQPQFGKEF